MNKEECPGGHDWLRCQALFANAQFLSHRNCDCAVAMAEKVRGHRGDGREHICSAPSLHCTRAQSCGLIGQSTSALGSQLDR